MFSVIMTNQTVVVDVHILNFSELLLLSRTFTSKNRSEESPPEQVFTIIFMAFKQRSDHSQT